MSTHTNCHRCGTGESTVFIATTADISYFVPYFEVTAQILDITPVDPSINLAPNHQDYMPNHRKQRRGKLKRSSRK